MEEDAVRDKDEKEHLLKTTVQESSFAGYVCKDAWTDSYWMTYSAVL